MNVRRKPENVSTGDISREEAQVDTEEKKNEKDEFYTPYTPTSS